MGRTLYLDCNSGISGDMTVGALLDMGADSHVLLDVLKSIKADGFDIVITKKMKGDIDCTDFDVVLDKEHDGHDHDMEYLYGHLHHHEHEDHEHDHQHHHHEHEHHSHHYHRGIKEIYEIIDNTIMTDRARKIAKDIFEVLAKAESKAHEVPVEEVHFHEVGAIDSIVDIISIAVCLDNLDVTEVIVPKLYDGKGTVRCQHGILPVPVPAVKNIVSDSNIDLEIIDVQGELVTPTGAATVAAIRTKTVLPEKYETIQTGYGNGKRDYGLDGVLKAAIIR
ncbi:LarC family nickel insertion protein [Butyrivibrio fibrisolvens]|uniref:LarC family nickel insertion protein n=1 Tax=Pseudobutyrivibrio ruminis TaxID=46206 RepID=UPI0004188CBD|nr:LarC family nickel insertion protein [Pseudobutyrivibrio ruminis]MDC7279277.1 LarC family nickel insertion protein [Butyrivibrio fibrisolvens]